MIEQQQAMPLLLTACPSFEEAWQQHLTEHGSDLLYVAAASLAQHLLRLYQQGQDQCFPVIGNAIEQLHTEGSPWVREFATIGILESIQNVWANEGINPEQFVRWLGPESRRWWRGLNDFWSGQKPYVGEGTGQ